MKKFFAFLLVLTAISACSMSKADVSTAISATPTTTATKTINENSNINTKEFIVTDSTIPVIKPSNLLEVLRKKMQSDNFDL